MKHFLKTALTVFFATGFLFSFQSCLKDNDSTKTELLTTEDGWTLTNTSLNNDEIADALIALTFQLVPVEMQTPEYEAELREDFTLEQEEEECEKDDITFFKIDGDITQDQGVIKCFPDSPQSEPNGTWSCSSDEKQLILRDLFGETTALEVLDINESTLILQQSTPLAEEGIDLNFESIAHLEGWEELDGYDEFLAMELVLTFTFTAN